MAIDRQMLYLLSTKISSKLFVISKENILHLHLCGFKIHPLAYQLQYQAASDHEIPIQGIGYNNGKR